MSPTLRKEQPAHPMWCHEVKFDGYRIQIHKDAKNVVLFSKNGNDFTHRYSTIAGAVAKLPTKAVVLDAELTVCDAVFLSSAMFARAVVRLPRNSQRR